MKISCQSIVRALTFAGILTLAHAAQISYPFTAGSMAPTLNGMPAGVTASNFALGSYTFVGLSNNGGTGNSLRISGDDVGTATGTALAAGSYLSFSLTIPAGVTLNLTSLALDFTSNGIADAEFINVRVFSSIAGFDNVIDDTVGVLGKLNGGATSGTSAISLATPDSNSTNGINSNNGDFDKLTNQTVTFYLPFIRATTTSAADFVDIDNLTLGLVDVTPTVGDLSQLTAAAISPFEIALDWTETLADETGFVIERSVSGSGVWNTIITTAANVTTSHDLGVESGISYIYRISAPLAGGGSSATVTSGSVTVPAVASHAPLIIMPIGDSITEGYGATGGYRDPLFTYLTSSGFQTQYVGTSTVGVTTALTNAGQVNHEGHGSYATTLITGNLDGVLNPVALPYGTPPNTNNGSYWLTGIAGTRAAVYPDVILLMIGTNDMGMFQRTAAQTLVYYDALLTKLVTLRPEAMILCSTVLPYNGDLYPSGKDYSQREANNVAFNGLLPGLVATYQATGHRVGIYDMRQKINPANAATMLTADGVHPNQAGYNAIAAGWFDAFKQLPLIQSWRMLHFGSATVTSQSSDLADPDGDGAANMLEYAFGTDPMAAAAPPPLTGATARDAGVDYLAITFSRRKHADVRYVVEVSPDLAPTSWSVDTVQVGTPASLGTDFEQVTFRDRQPSAANAQRFMRVQIIKP